MELDLPNGQIRLSSRKDGNWAEETVSSISLISSSAYYSFAHSFWMVILTFGLENNQQYIDIFNGYGGTVVHRFRPTDPVKPRDRYYFTQESYNVLGVAWSSRALRTFPSGLPVGSEIQIIGEITKLPIEILLIRSEGVATVRILVRRNSYPRKELTRVIVATKRQTRYSDCDLTCHNADFFENNL
ncbi:hypothetical protein AB6A40_009553, partial [Gnathostoma spinigerum]